MNFRRLTVIMLMALAVLFINHVPAMAQSTISTGSIQGTVSDQQGAAVPNAKVTIKNKGTGQTTNLESNGSGVFVSGALIPGDYVVRVEAANFKTYEATVPVSVGGVSSVNPRLDIGSSTTIVEVTGTAVAVNTDQVQVQGVLGSDQIENLPVNGRNFLDLAQLEPGVQIQDGSNFDPTKTGFSSISFGGRFGRTARIEVDGLDVSDETVGTTTQDIPSSAIQEFQLSQSTLDLSNELTSSGAVNVVTRSGSNTLHGEAYGQFRDDSFAARLPGPPGASFQRSQFGGNVGGPVIKDRLFFFLDGERTLSHANDPVPVAAPFNSFAGVFPAPFHELDTLAKVDWNGPHGIRMFYRFSYFQNLSVAPFGGVSFQPFENKNRTRSHVVGADFNTGSFTHSFRFQYLKFQNNIVDGVVGSGLPFSDFPISMQFLNEGLLVGPSFLAPQETPQSDRQFKYDGSKVWGSHVIRYGVSYNHIQGGGYAKFFSIDPTAFVFTDTLIGPNASNPLDYQPDEILIGNGQGFSTEKSAFGFPFGGLGPDNRLGAYVGDSWKVRRNLTLTFGVRYSRDTGRTDSDLNTIQAVNQILPGLGDPVQQANRNFGPQAGIAWDPWSNGKTVIRAGIGEYFENVIYNNVLFDRPLRLDQGAFLSFPVACLFGAEVPVPFPGIGNQSLPAGTCAESMGDSAQTIADFQTAFQAATLAAGAGDNPNFLPRLIAGGSAIPIGMFAPNYKTPRSIQMNFGIQHELHRGTVLSVDYVRNVSLHYDLGVDVNHSGDTAFFDLGAAQSAISATNAGFGCGASFSSAATDCAIAAGAGIGNYAGNGLDSAADQGVGGCSIALGVPCAFPGTTPAVGAFPALEPIGRGTYNALDVKLVHQMDHPLPGIRHTNFQVSYTLSRFSNDGGASATAPSAPATSDQDFVIGALDNRNPRRYNGPSTLDRTHQLNFGGYFDLPFWFRVGMVGHFWSSLPTPLIVPGSGSAAIFQTDFTGDGTVQDPLPGTKMGAFGRSIKAGDLNHVIDNYNSTVAGTATPAGQVLINNGLFSLTQLQALGGVAPTIPDAPAGNIGLDNLMAFDFKVSWEGKFWHERLRLEPSVGFYNLFNFANYDPPGDALSGALTGSVGTVNGTTKNGPLAHVNQIGAGSGVFALGAPRVIEFGLKLTF